MIKRPKFDFIQDIITVSGEIKVDIIETTDVKPAIIMFKFSFKTKLKFKPLP